MKKTLPTQSMITEAAIGSFFHPRDLGPLGISYNDLRRLVSSGVIQRVAYGLYRLSTAHPKEFETIALVASAVPKGIICLLTALRIHGMGTQAPHQVWIALDRKARKPAHFPAQVRIVRFSGATLSYGVRVQSIMGIPVRVTSPARTVVDCFRYRKKIGLDIALEAFREAVRLRKADMDEIIRAAEVCRASTVVRTYLEALSS